MNKKQDKRPVQEINLTDSVLRNKQAQDGNEESNQQISQIVQQRTQSVTFRTYEENMIITTFNEIKNNLKESFTAGSRKNSKSKSQIITDPYKEAKSSTANANKTSIYGNTKEVPQPTAQSVQIDKQDPVQRAVYKEQVVNAEDEYRNMDDHKIELDQLFKRLQSDENNGLTADKAMELNQQLGDNMLPAGKKTPAWILFIKELLNWFAIMLWIGSGLCIMAYFLEPSQGPSNVYLAGVLIIVILITGIITFNQTAKSEALMESFKNFLPPKCNVYRDGKKTGIDSAKLVPGDIVEVNAGDKIPADLRVIQSNQWKVDNSALTGESDLLLRKRECTNDNPTETANLAFFGTLCREGQGKGVVIRIGGNTFLGQIALFATQGEKVKSPLRVELDRFVLIITIISLVLGVIFFFSAKFIIHYPWATCIVFGIGIIVANVPEGLLGCITISLAITAKRLHEKQVLIKNLEGVETLGSTSCICSDKTGTLTQNKMTVENVWYDDLKRQAKNRQRYGNIDYEYEVSDPSFKALQECATVSSEAVFDYDKNKKQDIFWLDCKVIGDASETAIVKFFQPIEDIEETRKRFKYAKTLDGQIAKMPFNSTEKYALSIVEYDNKGDSDYCIFIKGAPEKLWAKCAYILVEGGNVKLDRDWEKKFQAVNLQFGKNGERVLGFAKLHLRRESHPKGFQFDISGPDNFNFQLKDLTFVGLISLQDPPKESVPWAVKRCRSAGIKVIMVTGDQAPTAGAIAKQVNIIPVDVQTNIDLKEENENLSWEEATKQARAIIVHGDKITEAVDQEIMNGATDLEADKTLQEWVRKDFVVFARTTPAQKLRIVRACQKVGYIVGVTGDGVNDSPAIKQGDIGISMGISGSDVTKDAADMILLNDDFSSIVDGVEEGRKIFDNLKKTIVYLLTSNVTEIFPFCAQIIFLIPLPLSNFLMLAICVGTDILPAISLAYEVAELDIMIRRPRTKSEHLVTRKLITHAYLQMGVIATGSGFFAFFTTMWYYGFDIRGMFKYKIGGDQPAAARCQVDSAGTACITTGQITTIPWGSFDITNPNLGNPYLLYGPLINQSYAETVIVGNSQTMQTNSLQQLDWLFYGDLPYDLRQVFVTVNIQNGYAASYTPVYGIFTQCQNIPNSEYTGFATLQQSNIEFDESPLKYNYINGRFRVPVCYSTEALKYGQTAYFVGIVVCQWSNILSVKSKKMSFIYSPLNSMMFYGIALETFLVIFLCYVPGVQGVFFSRPLNIYQWCGGMMFSILLLAWVEIRKKLMRLEMPQGKRNWYEWTMDW